MEELYYFNNRVTVRDYTSREIADEEITSMLSAASHAPTTGGMQLYSVVVTRDAEAKRRLAPHHFNQPMIETAQAVLTFCADLRRFECWCRASDAKPGFRNLQSLVSAMLDATIFAQQFNTIAEMCGIGCCYIGTTTYNAEPIARELALPEMVIPLVTITIGYPNGGFDAQPRSERLPIEAIVHKERYADYDDARVRKLYAEKENLPVNRRFVEENGKQTLAQVFTDVRYPRQSSEHFSQLLTQFIKKQGVEI